MNFEWRPYQESAMAAVIQGFKEFARQLLVWPTGAGKTVLFAGVARHFQPQRTLVLAHREELLEQAREKILLVTGIDAEIEAAERVASLDAPVVVASVQTLRRENRRQRFPTDHFGLIVVDEAHHVLADSYQQLLSHFSGARILGVTATPDRGDARQLGEFFENIPHELSLLDLIRDEYLSRIAVKRIPLQIDLRGVKVLAGGDFDENQLGHAIEPYLVAITEIVARDYGSRKTLVFLPTIDCSRSFARLCQERGLPAEHIDGTSKDRSLIATRFREGETMLVSNCVLWTEGFDEPSIDAILCLRPTKIRSFFAQMVGRGTRIHPGKNHLLLLDFLWLTERHDLVGPASLIARDAVEAAALSRDGDLVESQEQYQRDRLASLARELEARRIRQREAFELEQREAVRQFALTELAVILGEPELANFYPTMEWHRDVVTARQSEVLEHAGIPSWAIASKGQASAFIDHIMRRREHGLATFKQLRALRKFGTLIPPRTLTFQRASEILDGLCRRR